MFKQLKNRQAYKSFYDELAKKHDNDVVNERYERIEPFIKYFRGRILELGCQTGGVTRILAKYADEVITWDIAEENIQKAKERSKEFKNIKFVCGFVEDIKYKNEFDIVALFEILEHVLDPQLIVNLSMDALKDDGSLFFSVPLENQIPDPIGEHIRNFNISTIKDLFKNWKYNIWITLPNNPLWIIGIVKKGV